MIARRDVIIGLSAASLMAPFAVEAQHSERVRRVGVLLPQGEDDPDVPKRRRLFEQGLLALGWYAPRDLHIDYRYGRGDPARMRSEAVALVADAPEVLLAGNTPTLSALRDVARDIPIVFVQVSDPIGSGFVDSFARPGGSITGFVPVEPSLGGKWVSLLQELAPGLRRVTVLFNPEFASYADAFFQSAEAAAPSFGLAAIAAPVHTAEEIEGAFTAAAREAGGGLVVLPDSFLSFHRAVVAAAAVRNRLPVIYPYRYYAVAGGLLSYGTDQNDAYREASSYVDRILRGASPADLSLQALTKYELVINLKTAKALGLAIPPSLLARADEVIE
jgi:putative ABC transport system substrate-binding protein